MSDAYASQEAHAHFSDARRSAFLHDVASLFHRKSNDLLPYHEISRRTAPEHENYRGVQTVRLDQIVGSVNRFEDFDRNFLPRNRRTMGRWTSIDRAWHRQVVFPPVQLVRVGEVYFVKDGNHRVSVAKEHGQEYIDAEVVEEHLRAPLQSGMSSEELIRQAEYAEFLRRTNLDRLCPDHDIRPSGLGDYNELWGHIQNHRRFLEEEYERRPIDMEEAVTRWYTRVYTPLVQTARKHNICQNRSLGTEADLYLWLMSRKDEIYDLYRRTREPFGAAETYVGGIARERPDRPGLLARLKRSRDRYSGRQRTRSTKQDQ